MVSGSHETQQTDDKDSQIQRNIRDARKPTANLKLTKDTGYVTNCFDIICNASLAPMFVYILMFVTLLMFLI